MTTRTRHTPIKKRHSIFPLAIVGFAAFLLVLAVSLAAQVPTDVVYRKVAVTRAAVTATKRVPDRSEARLKIPSINVNAVILDVGLTSEGDMAVPDSVFGVGWYSPGTRPGETGTAVIAGHNYWNHEAAVFDRLDQLSIGDTLSVTDADGVSTSFVVRETRTYNPADVTTGVFDSQSGVHLNLITCSGVWDPSTQSFSERLVVFTEIEATQAL